MRLRLALGEAEKKVLSLGAECGAVRAAHATDLKQWRAQLRTNPTYPYPSPLSTDPSPTLLVTRRAEVRTCELRRIAQCELLQERERAQQESSRKGAEQQHGMLREARAACQSAQGDAQGARARLATAEAEVGELRDQLSFLRSALSGPAVF